MYIIFSVYIVSCIYIYKYKTLLLVLYVQCMLQQLKANPFMVKLQVPGKHFPEGSGFPQNFHWHTTSLEHWCFALCIMEGNFYDLYKIPSGILFLVNKISNLSIILYVNHFLGNNWKWEWIAMLKGKCYHIRLSFSVFIYCIKGSNKM